MLHSGYVLFVHRAGHFLAVARDEGDGGAFVQKPYDVAHMMRGQVKFLRDLWGEIVIVFHSQIFLIDLLLLHVVH